MAVADKEMKLRIAILKELKRFIREGTAIEYLETKPEIFYSSQKLSQSLEKIMTLIRKEFPVK